MAAQEPVKELEVIQTDTKTWKIILANALGTPIDVSNYLLFFTVKRPLTDPDTSALIQKTITCPENAESEAGICYIVLSSSDTNITVGNYTYDIKMQRNSGVDILWRKTVSIGSFRVNATGTKRLA